MSNKTPTTIRVAVCGALGKMGKTVVETVQTQADMTLVATIDRQLSEHNTRHYTDLPDALRESKPDVCVDFTHPDCVYQNALTLIEQGCAPVIGTTGLSPEQLNTLDSTLQAKALGGLVVPNFAIGALLMMRFAQEAAQYFDHAEIIELHHNRKADAPSGTAIKTAHLMAENRQSEMNPAEVSETEILTGARGGLGPGHIPIHSVRLPGLVAHQEVLLAGPGQLLSLRHDSFDRNSFMPGVMLAIRKVRQKVGLTYGLESLLF